MQFTIQGGTPTELWNKLMKEVQLKRVADPYKRVPFKYYIQSLIGLVPKAGNKTRLIFHLSHPRGGASINAGIPKEACLVKYLEFEDTIKLCIKVGKNCRIRQV